MNIIHDTINQRFEVTLDGISAYLSYQVIGADIWDFHHTIVPSELGGRGVGSALAQFALDTAQTQHKKIIASCSFVAHYINKHPQYQPLLA